MPAVELLSPRARAITLDVVTLVSWADGRVSDAELAAVRGAASALVQNDPLDASRGTLAVAPRAPTRQDFATLAERERHMLLAAASWAALADGKRTPHEARALDALACRSELDDEAAELLFDIARWVRLVRPRAATTWAVEFERLVHVTNSALGPARSSRRRQATAQRVG